MEEITFPNCQRGLMESLILRKPHWKALTLATQDAFHLIKELELIKDFYLAGGIGLTLHFGHRFSVDLDFFSDDANAVGPDQRSTLPMPRMIDKTSWSKMKNFLEKKAVEAGRKRLEDLWE